MTAEIGLRAELAADATVAALVGARIYPEFMPENVTYPAITYRRVSTVRFNKMSGPDDLTQVRIQVDCWDDSYADVQTLAAAVINALDGVKTTLGAQVVSHCYLDSRQDLSEMDGDRIDRRVSLDFVIFLSE